MSHIFERGLSIGDVHGAAAGHFERQKGRTHQQWCDELIKACGTLHHQYTHTLLQGHFRIQKIAHQMKNVNQLLPSIFRSQCRHADRQMSMR